MRVMEVEVWGLEEEVKVKEVGEMEMVEEVRGKVVEVRVMGLGLERVLGWVGCFQSSCMGCRGRGEVEQTLGSWLQEGSDRENEHSIHFFWELQKRS